MLFTWGDQHSRMESVQPGTGKARYALAAVRIVLGFTFLWAFLDKLFGLTYSTAAASAWLQGGHPTKGYLSSSYGPLGSMFRDMAGNAIVDVLFMAGLFGVGVALTFGLATRLGGLSALAMVTMMYASHPIVGLTPHTSNPLFDDHVLEGAAALLVALTPSGDTLGLGRMWRSKVHSKWLQ